MATIVINLGSALLALGQLDEAGICFEKVPYMSHVPYMSPICHMSYWRWAN